MKKKNGKNRALYLRASIYSLIIYISFGLHSVALGGVNYFNGNFFISYSDIEIDEKGTAINELSRTYNSKSVFKGIFGFGWSSILDTHIGIFPDGTLIVYEYGGGSKSVFKTDMVSETAVESMIETLQKTMIDQGDLENTPQALLESRKKMQNPEYRAAKWKKYTEKKQLSYSTEFPEGMEWNSIDFGIRKITRIQNGYHLTDDYEDMWFDVQGKLTRIDRKNGNWSELIYKDNVLHTVKNANGSQYRFIFNKKGQLSSIVCGKFTSTYKFDGDKLIRSEDAEHNIYLYGYDAKINLSSITYTDGTQTLIEYEPETLFARKVTLPNGDYTEYEYISFYLEDGSKDPKHYASRITKVSGAEKTKKISYHEYLFADKPNGESYLKTEIMEEDGVRTERHVDDICGFAKLLKKGTHETRFRYDEDCRLTERSSDSESILFYRHPELGDNSEKITFNGKDIFFAYDLNTRKIQKIKLQDQEIALTYENSKLKTISDGEHTYELLYNTSDSTKADQIEKIKIDGKTEVVPELTIWDRIKSVKNEKSDPELAEVGRKLTEIHRLIFLSEMHGYELYY